jgi:hypothetical protein
MDALPRELIIVILSFLPSKQIINAESISINFQNIIRSEKLIFPIFKPNIEYLDFVLENY